MHGLIDATIAGGASCISSSIFFSVLLIWVGFFKWGFLHGFLKSHWKGQLHLPTTKPSATIKKPYKFILEKTANLCTTVVHRRGRRRLLLVGLNLNPQIMDYDALHYNVCRLGVLRVVLYIAEMNS